MNKYNPKNKHMHLSSIVKRTLIFIAVITSFGVLIHDTKLDQAASVALAVPLGLTMTLASVSLHGDGHTHAERGSYGKTTVMGMPRVQPRDDHRKFMVAKRTNGFNATEPHILVFDPTLA